MIRYLKNLMIEGGVCKPRLPDETWGLPEERAWKEVCALWGAFYTPYPDLTGQDPDFVKRIQTETLTIPQRSPVRPRTVDLKQLLPMPIVTELTNGQKIAAAMPLNPETPPHLAKQFRIPTEIPAQFGRPRAFDPLDGLKPNTPAEKRPLRTRPTARMNPDRAARMKAAQQEPAKPTEAPAVNAPDLPKTIRVR